MTEIESERDQLLKIAAQRLPWKRRADQILVWYCLLEWARLGGKTDEVPR
jgi:hypothetical protein